MVEMSFYFSIALLLASFVITFYLLQAVDFSKILREKYQTPFFAIALQILLSMAFSVLITLFIFLLLPINLPL